MESQEIANMRIRIPWSFSFSLVMPTHQVKETNPIVGNST
jgi:hypothetical protein